MTVRGALAAAFILGMCGVCVRPGFWQLDRLKQRKARNAAVEQAMRMPELAFDSATAAAIARDPDRFVNRRVRVTGTYDAAGEIVLRGRASEGNPGVHLVTPLVVPGVREALLVNRGFAPSPDAASLDPRPFAEPGTRTVAGILQAIPTNTRAAGEPASHTAGGVTLTTYRRLDLAVVRRLERRPVSPLYLQQLPDSASPSSPNAPVRVPLPEMGNGPHLSYAVQWFSFAIIGVVGLILVTFRKPGGTAKEPYWRAPPPPPLP